MARYQLNWELPIDLSNVRFIHLYRRKDDGSCSNEEECCEYTLQGDKIMSDGILPFANTFVDTLIEFGVYRYAVVTESFAGEISVCATDFIDFNEISKLSLLNFDPRGEIIDGTLNGSVEEKNNYEFEFPTNSIVNVLNLIKPKIGWVINNITLENTSLPSNLLRSLVLDKDLQLEINYKQQLFKLELTAEDEKFIVLNPHDIEFVPANTEQTITAVPDDCHDFLEWEGGPEDQPLFDKTDPSTIVTMDKSYIIHATAEPRKHLVTVNKNNNAAGEVTQSFEYGCGEDVRITADANEGFRFKRWEIKGGLSNIIYPEDLQAEYGEELDLKRKTLVFRVSGPVVIQAVFRRTFWLKISASNQWGITEPVRDVLLDEEDNFSDLTAITKEGGIFLFWRIESGAGNILSIFDTNVQLLQTIYISDEVKLVAVFSEIYDLKIKLFLSPDLCTGIDCNQEVFDFGTVSGAGEYNDGNNKPTISVTNITPGYEFVAWEIEEGLGFLDIADYASASPQEVLIKGDVVLKAVIRLKPINFSIYPNNHLLGNTRPGNDMIVTVRDVIEVSADILTERAVFYKWKAVAGGENIIPFKSDEFDLSNPGVQKIKLSGDVTLEAIFLPLYLITIEADFYGSSSDSAGEGSLIDLYDKKELVQINDEKKTSGLYTELDLINVGALCNDSANPCLFGGTKPGYFSFYNWDVIESTGPTLFDTQSGDQTIKLKGDLTIRAQYYQQYKVEIFRANPDTTNGVFTGDGFYKSNKENIASVSLTAEGQVSSLDSREYEFDRWRILSNEGNYKIDKNKPFNTAKANQSFGLMSDIKLRVYFLIPFTLDLQANIPQAASSITQNGDGTYRETEEVKIEAKISNELAYSFINWTIISGNVVWPVGSDVTDLIQNIKISEDTVLQANFELIYYTFNCTIRPDYVTRGNITGTTANGDYTFFDEIDIKAEANPGFVLKRFDIVSGTNDKFTPGLDEQTITLVDDFSIEPIFLQEYNVEVYIVKDASTMTPTIGIGSTTGSGIYDEEDNTVSLKVNVTNKKYIFERWEVVSPAGFNLIDINNASVQKFDIDSDVEIAAVVLRQNTLTLSVENNLAGKAIDKTKANSPYTNEEIIKITAEDNKGYEFSHWEITSGAASILPSASADETGISNLDTERERSFRISGDVSIKAVHVLKQYTLTVITSDGTLGTVSGSGTYTIEDDISLVATELLTSGREISKFTKWEVTAGSPSDIIGRFASTQKSTKINISGDLEITANFDPAYYVKFNYDPSTAPDNKLSVGLSVTNGYSEKKNLGADEGFLITGNPSFSVTSSDADWSFTEYNIVSGEIDLDLSSTINSNSFTIRNTAQHGDIFTINVNVEQWIKFTFGFSADIKSKLKIYRDDLPIGSTTITVKDFDGNSVVREITEEPDSYSPTVKDRVITWGRFSVKVKSNDIVNLTILSGAGYFLRNIVQDKKKFTFLSDKSTKVGSHVVSKNYKIQFKSSASLRAYVYTVPYNLEARIKEGEFNPSGVLLKSTQNKSIKYFKNLTYKEAQAFNYTYSSSDLRNIKKDASFVGWKVTSGVVKFQEPTNVNLVNLKIESSSAAIEGIFLRNPGILQVDITGASLGKTNLSGPWNGSSAKYTSVGVELKESTQSSLTGEGIKYRIISMPTSPGVKVSYTYYTKSKENDKWKETEMSSAKNVALKEGDSTTSPRYNFSGTASSVDFNTFKYTRVVIKYSVELYSHDPLMNGSAPSVSGVWGLKGSSFFVSDYDKLVLSENNGTPAYWIYHETPNKPKKKDRDRINKGMYLDGSIPGNQYIGWNIVYGCYISGDSNVKKYNSWTLGKNLSIKGMTVGTDGIRGSKIAKFLLYYHGQNISLSGYSGPIVFEVSQKYVSLDSITHSSSWLGKSYKNLSGNSRIIAMKGAQQIGSASVNNYQDEHKLFLTTETTGNDPKPRDMKTQAKEIDQMFAPKSTDYLKVLKVLDKNNNALSTDKTYKKYTNIGWRVIVKKEGNNKKEFILVAYDGGWLLYYKNNNSVSCIAEYKTGIVEGKSNKDMRYMPLSLTIINFRTNHVRISFKFNQNAEFNTEIIDPNTKYDKRSKKVTSIKDVMHNHYPAIKKSKKPSNSDGVAIVDIISANVSRAGLRRIMWDMRAGITSFGDVISESFESGIIGIKVKQSKDSDRFNLYNYEDN